jgi:hypothetical protein
MSRAPPASPAGVRSIAVSEGIDGCPTFAKAYSGFPVELAGVGAPHAAFLNESRTRGCWWSPVQEIRIRGPKTMGQPNNRFHCIDSQILSLSEIDRTPIHERYDVVPKGRLKIAQDVVLGKTSACRTVPSGTAEHRRSGFQPPDGAKARQTEQAPSHQHS